MALPLLALAGAQMALSIYQGQQSAKAQNKLSKQNAENAINAGVFEDRGINLQIRQEGEVAAQNKRKLLVDMIRAESTAKARGKEVTGTSIDRLMQSLKNQTGSAISDINYNLSGAMLQAEAQKEGTKSKTQSRINSVPRSSYSTPLALLEGGLNIATAAESRGMFD
jgi:hypothetical protein